MLRAASTPAVLADCAEFRIRCVPLAPGGQGVLLLARCHVLLREALGDESAVEAVKGARFVPAAAGEDPVPVRVRIPFRFQYQ